MRDMTADEVAALLGTTSERLPPATRAAISGADLRFRILAGPARDAVVLRVLRTLEGDLDVAGPHRKARWEDGWTETLQEFLDSGRALSALIPKFVKRNEVIRFLGDYVQCADPDFETHFFAIVRTWLFERWCSDCKALYEFGCGTAHNLVAFAQLFPDRAVVGLDWTRASLEIIREIAVGHGISIKGIQFDLADPKRSIRVPQGAGILTVGALEQLGRNFNPFLEYIMEARPGICINVETLYELYDADSLFDYVARRYLERRGYLQGYLARLRELECDKRIEILECRRTFGSIYHDGYSYVVWRPR